MTRGIRTAVLTAAVVALSAGAAVPAAMAAPAMPALNTDTSTIVAVMLMTLIAICTLSASVARACPISQPSTT